ncbi:MAG: 2-oxoacid:acceptor oxidoreductase subunit alpha [Oscillospiraceae bacterium]|nr:2-oxoacid:acceptor oxidoreductase subunit alpha [Oscillospiraceae bacterium]
MSKTVLMQGNEAAVEGAIAAGMRFFAGYPITPSTEIAETCALRLPQEGGKFIQMEDEISSIAAVLGASAAGMKAMTATSGPGFSLMQENLGYGAMAEIPCVIVDVQRSGPSTGLPTSPSQGDYMQARWGTHGDHPVIALSPASVLETYTLMIRAFNLAEKYRTPVIFLMDEIVGHMREGVELPDPGKLIINQRKMSFHDGANKQCYFVPEGEYVPAMKPFGQGERYNITGLAHDESGFPVNSSEIAGRLVKRLLDKVEKNTDHICRVEEIEMDDAETAIVCFGGTTRAARDAVNAARAVGKKVGMFRPVTVWPFPEKQLRARLPQLKRILVVEHNHGQMLLEVQRCVGGALPVGFLGRIDGTVISPRDILARLGEMEGMHHAE